MTLRDRHTAAHAAAIKLYLYRQTLEQQYQQIQQQRQACDLALVKSDGAIELLEALIAADGPDGQ